MPARPLPSPLVWQTSRPHSVGPSRAPLSRSRLRVRCSGASPPPAPPLRFPFLVQAVVDCVTPQGGGPSVTRGRRTPPRVPPLPVSQHLNAIEARTGPGLRSTRYPEAPRGNRILSPPRSPAPDTQLRMCAPPPTKEGPDTACTDSECQGEHSCLSLAASKWAGPRNTQPRGAAVRPQPHSARHSPPLLPTAPPPSPRCTGLTRRPTHPRTWRRRRL